MKELIWKLRCHFGLCPWEPTTAQVPDMPDWKFPAVKCARCGAVEILTI